MSGWRDFGIIEGKIEEFILNSRFKTTDDASGWIEAIIRCQNEKVIKLDLFWLIPVYANNNLPILHDLQTIVSNVHSFTIQLIPFWVNHLLTTVNPVTYWTKAAIFETLGEEEISPSIIQGNLPEWGLQQYKILNLLRLLPLSDLEISSISYWRKLYMLYHHDYPSSITKYEYETTTDFVELPFSSQTYQSMWLQGESIYNSLEWVRLELNDSGFRNLAHTQAMHWSYRNNTGYTQNAFRLKYANQNNKNIAFRIYQTSDTYRKREYDINTPDQEESGVDTTEYFVEEITIPANQVIEKSEFYNLYETTRIVQYSPWATTIYSDTPYYQMIHLSDFSFRSEFTYSSSLWEDFEFKDW